MATFDKPILTVVITIVSDTINSPDVRHLEPCLNALAKQTTAAIEIIVPHLHSIDGIASLRRQYPSVRFLDVGDTRTSREVSSGSREHHDELRARGIAAANGNIVALIEDHGIPAPDWAAEFIDSHRQPFAGVGGAVENDVNRLLNWAVYFCDFLRYQNPVQEGQTMIASDANVAYKRNALESIRPVWQESFHERVVNAAIQFEGGKLSLTPRAVVYQHRQALRLGIVLKERFIWGRSYAASRIRLASRLKRLLWGIGGPAIPGLILGRMVLIAWSKKRNLSVFMKALPITGMLVASWALGEMAGYLTGRAMPQRSGVPKAIAKTTSAGILK